MAANQVDYLTRVDDAGKHSTHTHTHHLFPSHTRTYTIHTHTHTHTHTPPSHTRTYTLYIVHTDPPPPPHTHTQINIQTKNLISTVCSLYLDSCFPIFAVGNLPSNFKLPEMGKLDNTTIRVGTPYKILFSTTCIIDVYKHDIVYVLTCVPYVHVLVYVYF